MPPVAAISGSALRMTSVEVLLFALFWAGGLWTAGRACRATSGTRAYRADVGVGRGHRENDIQAMSRIRDGDGIAAGHADRSSNVYREVRLVQEQVVQLMAIGVPAGGVKA